MVWNYLEEKWEARQIHFRSKKKKYQYWEAPIPAFDYDRERLKERKKQISSPDYVDPKLEAYREQEWDRRLNGFWFMNNGVPTYITGKHYFFLTHWHIDIGLPSYRDIDRDYFLFLQYAIDHPKHYGIIEMTKRRAGKSARAQCVAYEVCSRMYEHHAGIQSKSETDAKKFYNKLIKSFKKLPDFFIPKYDKAGVKGGLHFQESKTRGDDITEFSEELESTITYGSGSNLHYDGTKLHVYIRDEAGKVDTPDPKNQVYEGWEVIRPSLTEDEDIIGTAIYTSTVEEQGSESFQLIWDESNPKELGDDGTTTSGLLRFFVPAYKNHFKDNDPLKVYGKCDEQYAMDYHEIQRKKRQHSARKLVSYIRKYPFTPTEAFYRDGDESPFDTKVINERIAAVRGKEDLLSVRGSLSWKDGIPDTKVIFAPTSKGNFLISRSIMVDQDGEFDPNWQDKWNNVAGKDGEFKKPLNTMSIIAGADTFDHKADVEISDRRGMSLGAAYVFHKFDALDESLSEKFLCQYKGRPDNSEVFFEEMVMMCHFFGCKILVERAKVGVNHHFDRRGYQSWLAKERGTKLRGIAATAEAKQQMAEATEVYISQHIDKVDFLDLLEDWRQFSLAKSTKYDCAMGAGWTIVAAYRIDRQLTPKKTLYGGRKEKTLTLADLRRM